MVLRTDPAQVKVMLRHDVCPIEPETAGLSDGSPCHHIGGPGWIPACGVFMGTAPFG